MLTAMTEEDWTIVLRVFAASRSRRGDFEALSAPPFDERGKRISPPSPCTLSPPLISYASVTVDSTPTCHPGRSAQRRCAAMHLAHTVNPSQTVRLPSLRTLMLRNTDCLAKRCLRRAIVVNRQVKIASHPVHLSLIVSALRSTRHADCLCELSQSVIWLPHFAVRIRH